MKPCTYNKTTLIAAALLAVIWPSNGNSAANSASVAVSVKVESFASLELLDPVDFALVVRKQPKVRHRVHAHILHDWHGRDQLRKDRWRHDSRLSVISPSKRWPAAIFHPRVSRHHDTTFAVLGRRYRQIHSIDPVSIRFKVHGNANTAVTVKPSEFLRTHHGVYLGQASKRNVSVRRGRRVPQDRRRETGLGYNLVVRYPTNGWSAYRPDVENELPAGWASLPGDREAGTPPLVTSSPRAHGALGVVTIVSESDWTSGGKSVEPGAYLGTLEITVSIAGD